MISLFPSTVHLWPPFCQVVPEAKFEAADLPEIKINLAEAEEDQLEDSPTAATSQQPLQEDTVKATTPPSEDAVVEAAEFNNNSSSCSAAALPCLGKGHNACVHVTWHNR